MDKEYGLLSSLLPHREDSIRDLEPLLALVINFIYRSCFSCLVGLQEKKDLIGHLGKIKTSQ